MFHKMVPKKAAAPVSSGRVRGDKPVVVVAPRVEVTTDSLKLLPFQAAMVLFRGMKGVLVAIDKAGRVVLPKDVREELSIHPGDLLKVTIRGNEVTLSPNREACGFLKRGKALVFSTGQADLLDNETVEKVRKAAHRD